MTTLRGISFAIVLAGGLVGQAGAACFAMKSPGRLAVRDNQDPLARFLAASDVCPPNVFDFRTRLIKAGAQLNTSLVGNRGFHNPSSGSFSLFEAVLGGINSESPLVPGEFFFGHFTATSGQTLIANQSPEDGNLMIELLAFDRHKGVFNFYEVMGNGSKGEW